MATTETPRRDTRPRLGCNRQLGPQKRRHGRVGCLRLACVAPGVRFVHRPTEQGSRRRQAARRPQPSLTKHAGRALARRTPRKFGEGCQRRDTGLKPIISCALIPIPPTIRGRGMGAISKQVPPA